LAASLVTAAPDAEAVDIAYESLSTGQKRQASSYRLSVHRDKKFR